MNPLTGQAIISAGVEFSHASGFAARYKGCYLDIDHRDLFESLKYVFIDQQIKNILPIT